MFKSLLPLLALCLAPALCLAQPKPAPGNFSYSAPKVVARQNGIRLEGTAQNPARINSPQISVVAPTIAFDLGQNTISQVRAQGGTSFKLSINATPTAPKTYIEAKATSATLDIASRTLQLNGNLSGFYQIGEGAKNTLSGERATLVFARNNLNVQVENPTLRLPAETLSRADALGELEVSAQKGDVNQSSGTATFSGQARARSVGGANSFDLTATSFVIKRGPDQTLDTLTTQGKTVVKYDLPPDPAAKPGGIGTPTRVEVSSDGAVFNRATSKATFAGNVRGFYRLQTSTGPQDFPFSGERAVISYGASPSATENGLNVEVTGSADKPVQIGAPAFEF